MMGSGEIYTAAQVFVDGAFQPNRFLEVQDGRIVAVHEHPPGSRITDFGEAAIFPGVVNTHTHTHLALLRGSVNELDLAGWLKAVYERVATFGPEEAYLAALLTFGEALLSGTTTTADFFYLNGHGNDNVHRVIEAADQLGIRLVMGRTFLDAEWGGDATRERTDIAVSRFRELRAATLGRPRLQVCPAPHSPYGASRSMIEAAAALAAEYDCRWYMHVAESESSAAGIDGTRALPLLDEWGVLDERLVAVHAVWLTEDELDRLGAVHGKVSYNPVSNLFFGERVLDLASYRRRGIDVAIGTDSSASNNSQNVFADLRVAALSQRLAKRDPAAVSDREMLDLATASGGDVTGLPIGRLATGQLADFVVLDLGNLSLVPRDRLAANIVYAMDPRAIRHVYVDGAAVVRDGTLANVDLAAIVDRIDAAARRR